MSHLLAKLKKSVYFLSLVLFFSIFYSVVFAALPTVGTIIPASGTTVPDAAKTFTCTYSDLDGWANINQTYLLINLNTAAFTNSVYLYYNQNTNLLYLRDDANSAWLGGYAPGSANLIENSSVKLNCSATTASGLTNTLTVKFSITFKTMYSGKTYNTYLKVVDDNAGFANWLKKGTYSINRAPQIGTIAPASGTGQANVSTSFTTTYSDSDGWQNIQYVYFLVNTSTAGTYCLYGYYNQNTNKIYLRNDANTAWLGGFIPGSANVIENSYSRIDCSKTTISGSGTNLMINWNVIFKSTFTGSKKTYCYVRDDVNAYKSWTQVGTWSIQSDVTPPTGTIKINNDTQYTNSSQTTLNLTAQDNIGGSGISQMQISNDNVTWGIPEAFAASKSWDLGSGDGIKTVYVKFKDTAGNWSLVYSDTITLDTTQPELNITSPLDNAVIRP